MKKRALLVLLCTSLAMTTMLSGCRAMGKAIGKAIKESKTSEEESDDWDDYDWDSDYDYDYDLDSEYGWGVDDDLDPGYLLDDDYDDYDYDDNDYDDYNDYYDEDTQEIGDDIVGYLTIPASYHKFVDVDTFDSGRNIVQAQADTLDAVITMEAFDGSLGNAETLAGKFYQYLDEDDEADDVTGAKVKVGNYDAYQVYCVYPNGASDSDISGMFFYVIWVFETPDENEYVHTIAAEFTSDQSDIIYSVDSFHY